MSDLNSQRTVTAPRPNPAAKWVCGYARIGLACAAGPDDKGVCCQLRRDRPRPTCTAECHQQCSCSHLCQVAKLQRQPEMSSQAELGPCIPRRAAWYWRQTLMLNMAILAAGILLLCMSLPQREAIFAPGGLSQKHAQILGTHLVSERCSLCHPNSHAGFATHTLQDDLCLKCHTQHLPAAQLRSPHDLPRAELVKLTAKWRPVDEAGSDPNGEHRLQKRAEKTSCAMCHVEHHGENFDLAAISDASCQACHQRQFSSLSEGHPQFENYPYRKPRHIAFDHSSHQQKHFGTKGEKFECARCHVNPQPPGQRDAVFRSVSFDQACASCHEAGIQSAAANGWAILQLPSIENSDALDIALALRDWPESARFGYSGEISVPVRLLLAADPELQAALAQLPASGQIEDVSSDHHLRAQLARSFAQGLRRLVAEVAVEGHIAWQRRLKTTAQQMLARDLLPQELKLINVLSQGIPPDLFRQMEQQWFANPKAIVARGLRPLHLASQPLPTDTLLPAGPDSLLQASHGSPNRDPHPATADDLLLQPLEASPATEPETSNAPRLTKLRGSVHVAAGGWYLDHDLLAVRYMPRGHADPTLAAWAEFVALLDAANNSSLSNLTHGVAVPGGCTQCHLLYPNSNPAQQTPLWMSRKQSTARRITKFDHTPHLALPALNDCSHCHVYQSDRADSLSQLFEAAIEASPSVAPSSLTHTVNSFLKLEFTDMRLEQCVACHRPGGTKTRAHTATTIT